VFRIGLSELAMLGLVCLCIGLSLGITGTGLLVRTRHKQDKSR